MNDASLEPLTVDECKTLLRTQLVGRIAVVVNDFPVIVPVNYRIAETSALTWIAIRTRPGNVVDHAPGPVAFEVDSIDPLHREGWSVLVRGSLHRVDPDAADFRQRFGPDPWILAERDRWLVIQPFEITGRRLRAPTDGWPFQPNAYL